MEHGSSNSQESPWAVRFFLALANNPIRQIRNVQDLMQNVKTETDMKEELLDKQNSEILNRRPGPARLGIPLEILKFLSLIGIPLYLNFFTSPGILLFWYWDPFALVHQTLSFASSLALNGMMIIVLKWALAGHIKPGKFHPNRFTSWRRWFLGRLQRMVNTYTIVFLFAGAFPSWNIYARLMGTKFEDGASSVNNLLSNPEDAHLITLKANSFASACFISPKIKGSSGAYRGTVTVSANASLGLGCIVKGFTVVESYAKVAWLTLIYGGASITEPSTRVQGTTIGKSMMKSAPVSSKYEYKDMEAAMIQRCVRDIMDIFLQLVRISLRFMTIWAAYDIGYEINQYINDENVKVIAFGFYALLWSIFMLILSIVFKWIMVRRFVSKSMDVSTVSSLRTLHTYDELWLTSTLIIRPFAGTFVQNAYLNIMGAKIGSNVVILGHLKYDFDLVTVGSHTVIERGTHISGHVFVDKKLNLQELRIGDKASIGAQCYLNKGSVLDKGRLLSLSKVMSGVIGKKEVWNGIPARPVLRERGGVMSERKRSLMKSLVQIVSSRQSPVGSRAAQVAGDTSHLQVVRPTRQASLSAGEKSFGRKPSK